MRRRSRYTGRKRKRTYRKRYNNKRRRFSAPFQGNPKTEKKFLDMTCTNTSLPTGGQVCTTVGGETSDSQTIVDIVQGTGQSERIGRKCTITKILGRFNFQFLESADTALGEARIAHETVRLMILWDKQCNGTFPAPASILAQNLYNSYRNLANLKRFTMLHDRIYSWNTTAIAASVATPNNASERVVADYQVTIAKNVFIPIEYSAATGLLADITSNNIVILTWTKHGARMEMESSKVRLRFIDI